MNTETSSTKNLTTIIERIKKLEALKASPNEHEAALAAARVQELLFKYNLDMETVDAHEKPSDYTKEFIRVDYKSQTPKRMREIEWKKTLWVGIAETNFCEAFYHDRAARGMRSMPTMSVVGRPHNITVVKALFSFLVHEIDRLAELGWLNKYMETYQRGWGSQASRDHNSREWKQSFRAGATETVVKRLRAQLEADRTADSASTALVVVTGKELTEAVQKIFPQVGSREYVDDMSDYDGYRRGRVAGQDIHLGKMLGNTEQERETQRLLQ